MSYTVFGKKKKKAKNSWIFYKKICVRLNLAYSIQGWSKNEYLKVSGLQWHVTISSDFQVLQEWTPDEIKLKKLDESPKVLIL